MSALAVAKWGKSIAYTVKHP